MNMKRWILICELSLLGTLHFQTLLSESKDGVSGRVTDRFGDSTPGVSVTLHSRSAPFPDRSVVTDEQGRYFFDCVAEGRYELVFQLAGFLTEKAGDFDYRYPLHLRVDQVMNVGLPVTDVFYLAFQVMETATEEVIPGAEIQVDGQTLLVTDKCGRAAVALPYDGKSYTIVVQKSGYARQTLTAKVGSQLSTLLVRLNREG